MMRIINKQIADDYFELSHDRYSHLALRSERRDPTAEISFYWKGSRVLCIELYKKLEIKLGFKIWKLFSWNYKTEVEITETREVVM